MQHNFNNTQEEAHNPKNSHLCFLQLNCCNVHDSTCTEATEKHQHIHKIGRYAYYFGTWRTVPTTFHCIVQ